MSKKAISGQKVGSGHGEGSRPTQFIKGRSGNPSGRPRKKKSAVGRMLAKELESKIYITENGIRKKISKGHALLKQGINKAISGDIRSLVYICKLLPTLERLNEIDTKHKPKDLWDEIDFDKLSDAELSALHLQLVAQKT